MDTTRALSIQNYVEIRDLHSILVSIIRNIHDTQRGNSPMQVMIKCQWVVNIIFDLLKLHTVIHIFL